MHFINLGLVNLFCQGSGSWEGKYLLMRIQFSLLETDHPHLYVPTTNLYLHFYIYLIFLKS